MRQIFDSGDSIGGIPMRMQITTLIYSPRPPSPSPARVPLAIGSPTNNAGSATLQPTAYSGIDSRVSLSASESQTKAPSTKTASPLVAAPWEILMKHPDLPLSITSPSIPGMLSQTTTFIRHSPPDSRWVLWFIFSDFR